MSIPFRSTQVPRQKREEAGYVGYDTNGNKYQSTNYHLSILHGHRQSQKILDKIEDDVVEDYLICHQKLQMEAGLLV